MGMYQLTYSFYHPRGVDVNKLPIDPFRLFVKHKFTFIRPLYAMRQVYDVLTAKYITVTSNRILRTGLKSLE